MSEPYPLEVVQVADPAEQRTWDEARADGALVLVPWIRARLLAWIAEGRLVEVIDEGGRRWVWRG